MVCDRSILALENESQLIAIYMTCMIWLHVLVYCVLTVCEPFKAAVHGSNISLCFFIFMRNVLSERTSLPLRRVL